MIGDFLYASRRAVLATVEREMPLAAVREAREEHPARPPWPVLFAKAVGIAAGRCPELRQSLLHWPRPRIYEHGEPVGSVVVSKVIDGEEFLFCLPLRNPSRASVEQMVSAIRRAKDRPPEETRAFRRSLRYSRFPLPVRRVLWGVLEWSGGLRAEFLGTFGVSATAGQGAAGLGLVTPWACAFCYAPFRDDGTLPVRLTLDHRLLDGSAACRILAETEAALTGPVLRELSAAVGTTNG
jgi:hypothetical protein